MKRISTVLFFLTLMCQTVFSQSPQRGMVKSNFSGLLAFLLIIVGGISSCANNDDDIDMSQIDFRNIENLYEQPLPVIKKCVQGRWKPFVSLGGEHDPSYYDDSGRFNVINTDRVIYVVEYGTWGFNYTWKRKFVEYLNNETYVMWDNTRKQDSYYFHSIKNDTLVLTDNHSFYASDISHTFVWIRIDDEFDINKPLH